MIFLRYHSEEFNPPPQIRGYCSLCEKNVSTKKVDLGIGAYEYCGSKGVHTDLQDVCTDCGGDIEPERTEYEGEEHGCSY